jgi:hypothetical protein
MTSARTVPLGFGRRTRRDGHALQPLVHRTPAAALLAAFAPFDRLAAGRESPPAELTRMHQRVQGARTRPRRKTLATRLHEAVDNAKRPGWGPSALAVLSMLRR